MQVHLVDGTYELFRHHFGAPSHVNADGLECGAVRAVGHASGVLDERLRQVGIGW